MNLDGYKRVYQSGHTETWCNGVEHRDTPGGWVGIRQAKESDFAMARPYECSCAYWATQDKQEVRR